MSYKRNRAAFEADLQKQDSPYVFYGTPLPPLDDNVRDDGSFVPVWKQEVVDERGRKRLHGAFTGGFSAGYFNTVGSKDGWTPSTFVSSRASRQKDQKNDAQQRPEDFMDEEDLAEAAEAQKLQTASAFAGLGSTEEDASRRDPFMGLVKAGGDTVGVKLLQRMGWRQGQGVGPRIRRKARLDEGDEPRDANEKAHLFAPDDSPMIGFARKNDRKGLGYSGEARLSSTPASAKPGAQEDDDEDDSSFSAVNNARKGNAKKTARRGGFGVGILNDTGSDEEDAYEMGPRLSYNKTIGPDKKPKKTSNGLPVAKAANPLLRAKPVFVSKKIPNRTTAATLRKCHDGRLPLEGFVLATQALTLEANRYAPPKIPEGWKSAKGTAAADSGSSTYQSTADAAKASTLDPKSRAALLGEAALPGKSIFDYLSPSARSRIASATGKDNLPAALSEAPPEGYRKSDAEKQKDLWSLVPALDKDIADAALQRGTGGWMPYAEDERKRARYRAFIELKAGWRDVLPERAPGMSTDEWVKELQEFAHAARVFRPVTGMMASRFTSSTAHHGASSGERKDTPLLSKPPAKPTDPAEEAAKIGMYGPMTRSVLQFFPTRLVCKRFNVKPPAHVQMDPGDTPSGSAAAAGSSGQVSELVSRSMLNEMLLNANFANTSATSGAKPEPDGISVPATLPVEAPVDVETNEALEAERAGDAVFRAIFGSDDEDEDEA
ncbi:hypothetical protein W97_06682 [Coniosporium apollinis CBS 100218]|uniref:G-patch domain-containing protein n=1 Tax=Coniosporium apollinis (strain CBS 100218) TaxID=1168221 RepID=R7Z059_CONA1|nr:uncharacterized protein W97_06682 [Coniosporium apollinis CBS 100218]EON67429.1 hypothetical protein W97_06682 [Coniosporium apollinis CBS 100218]